MKVSQIMRQPVISMHENDTLEEAARVMLDNNLRGVPVVNSEEKLSGFLSVSDFLAKDMRVPFTRYDSLQLFGKWLEQEGIEKSYEEARTMPIKEIMSRNVFTVTEDESVERVVELMVHHGLHRIPIVRDGVLVGIVARFDLLRMVLQKEAPKP
jgi:CBS domain-containing protein